MQYICDFNSDCGSIYEIVGTDGIGEASCVGKNGRLAALDYTDNDYSAMKKIFGDADSTDNGICCTPEFTDQCTANRSFALYGYIRLYDEKGTALDYTLLSIYKSSSFADLILLDGGYDGISAVLVNNRGDYVFGSSQFKSDNIFRYFYIYNDLTVEEMQADKDVFSSNKSGHFYYMDARGSKCVFVYSEIEGTDWYCVTAVPFSSFHTGEKNYSFIIWVSVLLCVLMMLNLIWLDIANKKLRLSVKREKELGSAKTDFLSCMSHDIRTPLNGIIGAAILAKKQNNPPATAKYLNNIDKCGKFLLSLVNDILDLNKVENGKMELHLMPYSYKQFSDNIKAIIGPLCSEKSIKFEISRDEGDRAYMLDPVRVNQVFVNILSNSVKFTDPGGHISLRCTSEKKPDGRARLHFVASDDGKGMSEEFQKHMFDAFSQEESGSRQKEQGTGLGLAIVKNMVTLMNGEIKVDSIIGRGTSFYVTLVCDECKMPESESIDRTEKLSALNGKHALLCEDNGINTEIAQAMLDEVGIITECASDGKEGLEKFINSEPGFYDVILMDLRMPVMDGLEATIKIRGLERKDAKTVPIIAMTANAYDIDVKNCLDAGMNSHFSKPVDPEIMYDKIAREITKMKRYQDNN